MEESSKVTILKCVLGEVISLKRSVKRYTVLFSLIGLALISWVGIDLFHPIDKLPIGQSLKIPNISCPSDKDNDGITDLQDIVKGARAEVNRKPHYRSAYYQGGFPPDSEGVCTDVVWRAMRDAGYNLKALVDKDIRENPAKYSRIAGNPDPNIDFRRVPNLIVFFRRYGTELTRDIKPGDAENLYQWQPGDIVIFDNPHEHVAIISDKRRKDGVPYILHIAGPTASETDQLQSWPSKITGHFRFPKF
ncbi:hypothetical protein Desaci_2425 [Desulfosporosinus acidiphilus SJ4]|uniref:DUF1287 domain-containing protein n=1 Tax=Desulfosporosinus acidiphilus (strain DSM 22704 / JCM 16185 / SJ4) TaxID=646529 RepID=I4D6F1_DESAJ|nr:DUF1287 domain-containing protein [Desulfosporosinus acidiphilus]AFM41375.1 hypothetical protein Desaci_2425 [Desulfosporosinus acidiphilus SJ4]